MLVDCDEEAVVGEVGAVDDRDSWRTCDGRERWANVPTPLDLSAERAAGEAVCFLLAVLAEEPGEEGVEYGFVGDVGVCAGVRCATGWAFPALCSGGGSTVLYELGAA